MRRLALNYENAALMVLGTGGRHNTLYYLKSLKDKEIMTMNKVFIYGFVCQLL